MRSRIVTSLAAVSLVASLATCKTSGRTTDTNPGPATDSAPETSSNSANSPRNHGAVEWEDPRVIATGGGTMGEWRMNESTFHYVDDPTVTMTNDGGSLVTFVDNRKQDAFFQRYSPEGVARFPSPVNVSRNPEIFTWLPSIVAAPKDDNVYVLWQEIIFSGGTHGGEILFARSLNGGKTFGEPINLSNTTAGCGKGRIRGDKWHNGSLDLTRGPDGTLYAAWTEYQGPLRFSRSTDEGDSFSEPLFIAGDDATPTRGPAIAVDDDRTVYLAWAVGEDSGGDVRLAVSTDGGESFGEPRVVEDTANYSDAPKLVVDSTGVVHMVWSEGGDGYDGPDHVRYTRFDGEFSEPRRLASVDDKPASFPYLEVDAGDRLFVVWEHHPLAGQYPRGLGFAYSTDRGESFSKPRLVPQSGSDTHGFNGNLQGQLTDKLAVNDAGEIAVVNGSFVPGDRSAVFLILGSLPL